MDVRFLKSLLAVIDKGSIADAARHENLTSSAVSQRIQALERELGVTLFSRIGNTAKPTESCMRLVPRARKIVQEIQALKTDLDPVGLTGELRIGAISTALTGLIPQLMKKLMTQAPDVKLSIVPGTSASLYERLIAEELDAIVVVDPPFDTPKMMKKITLYVEPLVFIKSKSVSLPIAEAIQSKPYIQYDPHSWGGRLATEYLHDQQITVDPLCDLDGLEAIAILVSEGVGVSLIPYWQGLEKIANDIVISNVDVKKYQREITLLHPVQTINSRLISFLVGLINEE
ncbi:LysR family transcriptional regulator [Spartinivicinus poritis]|uniref:LysR family transcriptional regulator n=1 Tax=Spartinivicinus poritis TaxID=2994640 RepID=A0ABT5U4R4_9GAMM|nr:LysR family transcriptional regulator [Spartinivicinus sp. A2-2]MDE1461343.1 LysR family transcriptional regulator [Spartinivicinus sp. A2-2]